MLTKVSLSLVFGLISQAAAAPAPLTITPRASTLFTLPTSAINASARSIAIALKRSTFTYGVSPVSPDVNQYPTGVLGDATWAEDVVELDAEVAQGQIAIYTDLLLAEAALPADGLTTLQDYENLYDGQWKNTLPDGPAAGLLSNYTQDLLFSMERLSANPYSIKRLDPSSDTLAFDVDDTIATNLTGETLDALFASGSLFYVDHRDQATYALGEGRYAPACDAYFYIDCDGDFLPLAVRTDNASMIYTPEDTADDWLLAKMFFNMNDGWFADWYHFAGTHFVVEITYAAAYRTLSDDHPVLALLGELTPQLYSYAQTFASTLAPAGGLIDVVFSHTGAAATNNTAFMYNNGVADFQANYFLTDLTARGLINCTYGPALKSFPWYDDALVIHTAIETFVTSFVDSYYADDAAIAADTELTAWIAEATPAEILDFPTQMTKTTLIEIITHVAYLSSVVHHTLNSQVLGEVSVVLPFHPMSLFVPVPTEKNATDLVQYLPPASIALEQIVFSAVFTRPQYFNSSQDLSHMFATATILEGFNNATAAAGTAFMETLDTLSDTIEARTFDTDGLAQGMPFAWKALDPRKAPFHLMA